MRNPVYPKINDNVPNFIKEEYPNLHHLLLEYFKWLETDENFIQLLVDFRENIEVNNQVNPYIDIIKNELGWFYNVQLQVDDRTLIKLLRDFYSSRGTEKSFKILFKLLFNEEVEITYPRDRLFKTSDNNFVIEHRIITSANNIQNENFRLILNSDVLSANIKGKDSKLILVIDKIVPLILNENYYFIIYVNKTTDDFIPDEQVEISAEGIGTFIETVYSSTELNIINRGRNYKKDEKIIITDHLLSSGGANIIGEIVIDSVSTGGIDAVGMQSIIIEDPETQRAVRSFWSGANYKTGDKIVVTSGAGNGWGFDARVVTNDTETAIFDFSVIDGVITEINTEEGIGYITKPNIVITDEKEINQVTNAIVTCNEIIKNYVGDVIIIHEGYGYTSPTITFSAAPAGGTTAQGTAVVLDGKIKSIIVTIMGSGYTSPPTITITQSGNTSAEAQAILMGSVTNITIISGGKNYVENEIKYVIEPPESSQLFAKKPICTVTITDGLIDDLKLINGGSGYTTVPNITTSNGTGFSAVLELLDDSSLELKSFIPGNSHNSLTTISVDPPTNIGKIKYIDVINRGYGFENLNDIELGILTENGNGAIIYPDSYSIGKIEKIKIISDYWHYNKIDGIINPNVIIETEDGSGAILEVDKNTCINRRLNKFENFSGLLEFNAFLHDSYYYQQFSYETNSKCPSLYSNEIINDLLHPVGFLKFDLFTDSVLFNTNEISFESDINEDGFLNISTVIDFNYNKDLSVDLNLFTSSMELDIKAPEEFGYDIFFKADNNLITFNINNIEDIKYNPRFDHDLTYFKDYPMSAFTENQNIAEMITLDIDKP
jgi:hypothetical protein